MEKDTSIIWFVLILLLIAAGFYFLISVCSKARRRLNGVENYDAFQQRFVYRIDLPIEKTMERLRRPSIYDSEGYEFSDDLKKITFSGTLGPCELNIEPQTDGCILFVRMFEPNRRVMGNGPAYDLMNEFWIRKLQAKPIDFYDWLRSRNENDTGNGPA